LEFNVPFQHKYGYIRDEITTITASDSFGAEIVWIRTQTWPLFSKFFLSFFDYLPYTTFTFLHPSLGAFSAAISQN